ncbi:glycosyltransferase family 2 protein [Oleisolibacter albus]|uniref:glycosyltransferase family 2 protein n=1 Tax=Oleisolibacter albus TaxID=2171757 RepID=UPI000DF1D033|nr:glycosyltransferase family 2 protein [Oleisolibacter albus]
MNRLPLSIVVMTRNEAANIGACLDSLAGLGELVVVDSGSDDGTPALAAAGGAWVVPFQWNGRYPRKKQWCLDLPGLHHDWVLFVDADERVTPTLRRALERLFRAGPDCAAYFIDSRPLFLGRMLRFGTRYRKIALMHRRRCRFPDCEAGGGWEVEGHYQPAVRGRIGRLGGFLLHVELRGPHWLFDRHNRYSDWEAAGRGAAGSALALHAERPWRRLLKTLFQHLPLRPLLVFLHAYLLRLGLLDGQAGLDHALFRAFYYWQVELKRRWAGTGPTIQSSPRASSPARSPASLSPASALISSKARRRTGSS